ncbi:hypothetical protein K5Q02_11380 [Pseudomonas sp. MM211]|uniref:hypothetical protein n=1 Tax=Pseudomonas sp. MM211 TaxID=2866808 RepID=UPI001CEDEBA4|nr:hypothetical protein [Pseudomonas sp. MM211]UCJ18918.1 hypothetical protein K5Q02_11380 [Pseudomonas sp. MM211]
MSNVDRTKLLLLQKYGTPSMQENATIVLKALQKTIVEDEVAVTKALLDKASQPLLHGSAYDSIDAIIEDIQLKLSKSPRKSQADVFKLLLEQRMGV